MHAMAPAKSVSTTQLPAMSGTSHSTPRPQCSLQHARHSVSTECVRTHRPTTRPAGQGMPQSGADAIETTRETLPRLQMGPPLKVFVYPRLSLISAHLIGDVVPIRVPKVPFQSTVCPVNVTKPVRLIAARIILHPAPPPI